MKCVFLGKRGRPDIMTGVSVLSTRVLSPREDDWNKLTKILGYLKTTINKMLQFTVW